MAQSKLAYTLVGKMDTPTLTVKLSTLAVNPHVSTTLGCGGAYASTVCLARAGLPEVPGL